MKIIITGATGVIGGPIVQHCIRNPSITGIFVLARKELPADIKSPKVTYINHQDFSSYPQELLKKLAGAEGCIWALGGSVQELGGNYNIARKITVDWPVKAAQAFTTGLRQYLPLGQMFRFGQAEMALIDLQSKLSNDLNVWCVRPYGVVPTDATSLRKAASKWVNFISADDCGAAMVNILLRGHHHAIIEHEELQTLSRDRR
ncbi:hypothetical protein B0O99DRAFT_693619 [Bisporella sp. PMI_857]|nr:hypothetical protein B0O99DRAFT_693619 [Bisporella sp. PMI_857]